MSFILFVVFRTLVSNSMLYMSVRVATYIYAQGTSNWKGCQGRAPDLVEAVVRNAISFTWHFSFFYFVPSQVSPYLISMLPCCPQLSYSFRWLHLKPCLQTPRKRWNMLCRKRSSRWLGRVTEKVYTSLCCVHAETKSGRQPQKANGLEQIKTFMQTRTQEKMQTGPRISRFDSTPKQSKMRSDLQRTHIAIVDQDNDHEQLCKGELPQLCYIIWKR